jgi:pilus assembly protein CpaB
MVLAVDQTAATEKNEPVVVRAVTLEVTPADAERLALAAERGAIQLALRNPLDDRLVAMRSNVAVAAPAPASPAAPAAKPRARIRTGPPPVDTSITVIRGTAVGKETPKSGG